MSKQTIIALEGVLDVRRQALMLPAECSGGCVQPYAPALVGITTTETGAANIANVERYLEMLNGQYVRVIIEIGEPKNEQPLL